MTDQIRTPTPLFQLGHIVSTVGVSTALSPAFLTACLRRHHQGDWGCIDADDRAMNDAAVKNGNRILSAYPLDPVKPSKGYGDNTLWIITEADRSTTTLLLPDEY